MLTMPVKPLLIFIATFVVLLTCASSLKLAAGNNNYPFRNGGAAAGRPTTKSAPNYLALPNPVPILLVEQEPRDPMKWTDVAMHSSAMNCIFELDSRGLNTVCVRVVMPLKENNANTCNKHADADGLDKKKIKKKTPPLQRMNHRRKQ